MGISNIKLLADEQIEPEVIKIIREARKTVVLVTPYLNLTGHMKGAIEIASKQKWEKVQMMAIVRLEDKVIRGNDVAWLGQQGVEVRAVEDLHAKIYMTEKAAIVGSMNLTEYSTKNSREIAFLVGDRELFDQIQKYIKERLIPLAQPVQAARQSTTTMAARVPAGNSIGHDVGYCIRCKERIALDPGRPLCADDYEVWAEYSNENYQEEFCHSCGRQTETTYAKPLCRECYRRLS